MNNIIDKEIEYKSVIMRCDNVNMDAFIELSPGIIMDFYTEDMEYIWLAINYSQSLFARDK